MTVNTPSINTPDGSGPKINATQEYGNAVQWIRMHRFYQILELELLKLLKLLKPLRILMLERTQRVNSLPLVTKLRLLSEMMLRLELISVLRRDKTRPEITWQ